MAEAKPSTSNMSGYDPSTPCDPCSLRDTKNQAGTYCQDCSEYLCNSCEDIHHSSKDSQNHTLQTLKGPGMMSSKQRDLVSSIMTCEVHREEVVTLFCASHKTVICHVCNSVNHRQCETKLLRQVAREPKSQKTVRQCTEQIKSLLKDFKEIKDSRDKNKELINDCSNDCLEQVTKVKLIAWAEKLARDMTNKIKKSKDVILTDLEKDTNTLTQIDKQFQEITSTFETLGEDLEEAAFVLMMKEEKHLNDTTKLKNDMLKQPKPVALEFYQSKKLQTLMSEITSMGKLEYQEEQMHKPDNRQSHEQIEHQFCFRDISSVCNKKAIDAGATWVTGCAFMPNGELVICDRTNKSVKVFTQDFKLRNEMKFRLNVWDVTALSKTQVIVTKTQPQFLQILKISRNIEKCKSIRVGMNYWGIDYKNDRLYVSGHNGDGGVLITVLTLDGVIVNSFNISHAFPYYLAVNHSGNRILVSGGNNSVLCFDNSGNALYTYSDRQFDWNAGLLFDSKDNFLVCGGRSHNIYLVTGDDSKHTIPLTSTDGLHSPYCLAYRPVDRTLVVGQNGMGVGQNEKHSLLAFTMNSGNLITKIKLEI